MTRKLNTDNIFEDALANLGHNIAATAARHEEEANTSWERIRTFFTLAQALGAEQLAFTALYEAGDKTLAKKAIWYRRQKRLLSEAMQHGIKITDDMDMKQLSDLIASTRRDSRTPEEREADAMQMLTRTTKGAMNAAVDKKHIASLLMGAIQNRNQH